MQLVVNERQQVGDSLAVALFRGFEDASDVEHVVYDPVST